jgi:hypothetical protein
MINPDFLRGVTGAIGSRAADEAVKRLGPSGIKAVQRISAAAGALSSALGIDAVMTRPQPLLGGISLEEAERIVGEMQDAGLARKYLYAVNIEDITPPPLDYGIGPEQRAIVQQTPLGSLLSVLSGNFIQAAGAAITGALNKALGIADGPAAAIGASNGGVSVPYLFNLFATDVSYSESLGGEKVVVGGLSLDKLHGREPVEVEITTLDDETGTLKRWFAGKLKQAAPGNGTVGLPDDYCIRVTIYHATGKATAQAFGTHLRMRPVSIQHDLSRSDSDLERLRMTFTQFDPFIT